jgi:hypothetical protein
MEWVLSEYELDLCVEPGYLRVTVTGELAIERSLRLVARVAEEAEQRGCSRVLLDWSRVSGPQFEQDDLLRIAVAAGQAFRAPLRVAMIDRIWATNLYGELLARNRGANAALFRLESDALAWLAGTNDG